MSKRGPKITESEKIHGQLNFILEELFFGYASVENEFLDCFEKLMDQSDEDHYYWQYCSFNTYQSTFEARWKAFLSLYVDAERQDFLSFERETILQTKKDVLTLVCEKEDNSYFYYLLYDEDLYACPLSSRLNEMVKRKIYYSNNKKMNFLNSLPGSNSAASEGQGKLIQTKGDDRELVNDSNPNQVTGWDFSDNSEAEKIVFMHELGILDHLRQMSPFNASTNKLAEVVSSFTGINQTTAQSYLNPIFPKNVKSKNNPLTDKNIQMVNAKLMKMGYIRKNQP